MLEFFYKFKQWFGNLFADQNQNQKSQNNKNMAMFNYGVGGNEVKVDANEAIAQIQENKSLIVSQLTTDESYTPEIVTGLKTVDDVFRHFQPSVGVQHEDSDGNVVDEEFRFKNLADFTPKNLVNNSEYLQKLSMEQDQYNKIVRQLKTNKILRNMLENEQSRAAFVEVLKNVAKELEK
ncbi:type VI secretion system contractile sheath small subunit [Chryseobacterium sp.]|uniref:type VI secretion system contractile sheath small subunit n=1 Tax=Chryseobacterium sp. TaxID=1871047 RepID=UPI0028991F01|nr:type VI secretion system contractile sheath small subunit [Chryseobacterium sp.]